MIINNSESIPNIDTLVCLPKKIEDKLNTFEYNFNYVFKFAQNVECINTFVDIVTKNKIKSIILVDYCYEYEMIIDQLQEKTQINLIFTKDLASFSEEDHLLYNNSIVDLYTNNRINKLGLLDINLYLITKKRFSNSFYIQLDEPAVKESTSNNKNGIGLINDCYDPKHSYFNELSAISLLDEKANIMNSRNAAKEFAKEFNIPIKTYGSIEEIIENSEIALYVNFCYTDNSLFIRSMDKGTMCILGNNSIINKNSLLSDKLQVTSDDDINEIANKIKEVRVFKEQIFNEYKAFREEYSQECKKSILNFLRG